MLNNKTLLCLKGRVTAHTLRIELALLFASLLRLFVIMTFIDNRTSLSRNGLKLLCHLMATLSDSWEFSSLISLIRVTQSQSKSKVGRLLSPTQLGHLYNILYGNISIYELFVRLTRRAVRLHFDTLLHDNWR